MRHFKTITSAAATLLGRSLDRLSAGDITVAPLTEQEFAALDVVQRRHHLATKLVKAYLDGQCRSDLVVDFCAADYKCPKPLFAPANEGADHTQLPLIA